jgi:hypothetical protein
MLYRRDELVNSNLVSLNINPNPSTEQLPPKPSTFSPTQQSSTVFSGKEYSLNPFYFLALAFVILGMAVIILETPIVKEVYLVDENTTQD